MTAPARVKEADIMRALRAAKKLGAKRVRVGPDGSIDIVLIDEQTEDRLPNWQPEAEPPPVKSLW
jgi:hypothetical protein